MHLGNPIHPREVQINPMQQKEGTRLDGELVQHVEAMGLADLGVNTQKIISRSTFKSRQYPNTKLRKKVIIL